MLASHCTPRGLLIQSVAYGEGHGSFSNVCTDLSWQGCLCWLCLPTPLVSGLGAVATSALPQLTGTLALSTVESRAKAWGGSSQGAHHGLTHAAPKCAEVGGRGPFCSAPLGLTSLLWCSGGLLAQCCLGLLSAWFPGLSTLLCCSQGADQ